MVIRGGGAKFENKHKSQCFQKCKLVDWGTKHFNWGGRPPGTSLLAPGLSSFLMIRVFWIRNVALNFCRKIFSCT